MTDKEIQKAADLLLEGQAVTIDDVTVKAVEVTEKRVTCYTCQFLDSCTYDMNVVCVELELRNNKFYRLELEDNDNENET